MALELPNNPKLADLAAAVVSLDGRVRELEGIAASNKARLDALDVGVDTREKEIDRLRSEVERERWQAKYRRAR